MSNQYQPPTVWQWAQKDDNKFASTNRPVAGATRKQQLPRGEHDLQLYSLATPNGQKVTIMLEELLQLGIEAAQYDAWFIDIGKGDQFGSDFVAINPNSKIPALLDYGQNPPQRVFESGAILLYLAERFGHFLPAAAPQRTECMSWLFWQMGSAPYLGGGFGHFYRYAAEKQQYPIDRFTMETKRQLDVLDRHLAGHEYMAGDQYSIADMAIWPWYGGVASGDVYDAVEFLQAQQYTNLLRWQQQVGQRPAVQRGRLVNRAEGGLRERHSASDFDNI